MFYKIENQLVKKRMIKLFSRHDQKIKIKFTHLKNSFKGGKRYSFKGGEHYSFKGGEHPGIYKN